jgi:hypothetical protein
MHNILIFINDHILLIIFILKRSQYASKAEEKPEEKPEEKFEFSLLMHEINVLPIELLGLLL